MKKKLIKIALALAALVTIPLAFQAKSKAASYDTKEMRSFVRNTIAKNKARGSVVVIKNGHAQQISYGYAYYGKRMGNGNSKIIYPVCSLQKVMTGAIIMQLIREGKITQDTTISRWYPSIQNSSNITIGNLLTHTSGIIIGNTEAYRGYKYSEGRAIDWVINQASQRKENKPGSFSYNNTNYILLAGIISKITGKTYGENVQERIIKPLNLKHTFLYDGIGSGYYRSISYTWNNHNYQNPLTAPPSLLSQLPGAANIYTTPMDYYKIQIGLTNGKILTQAQFNELTNLKAKSSNNYSGGVYIKNNGKLKMAYGNLHGTHFGNWFQMTSDNKNGLIMFLNQTQDSENSNKNIGYQILNHIKANTFSNR